MAKCRYEHFCFRNGCDGIDCMAQDANRDTVRVNYAHNDWSAKCVPSDQKYSMADVVSEGRAEFIPVANADYDYNRLSFRKTHQDAPA